VGVRRSEFIELGGLVLIHRLGECEMTAPGKFELDQRFMKQMHPASRVK
jgi:hypothetical protein